jgi:hypothetical protein
MIGNRLAHYEITARLGSGGMGDVYAAADLKLGRSVSSGNDTVGIRLAWAGDSRRLFYSTGSRKFMSVTVDTKPSLPASTPVVAHDLNRLRVYEVSWEILPNGRLLAVQRGDGEDDVKEVNIVLNWFNELRQRMAQSTRR